MLQNDELFLSKSSVMSKLRRDESQLQNEKKEYEKYQTFLKKEIDELFSKNEQLLSCFISHKNIFEYLELQNKLLEEQYKNEILEESHSKKIKLRLSQIKSEQDPIYPSRVLIPMENNTRSQYIQLSKEYNELEKKISEINIDQISKLLEEKQKLAERHIELKKEAAYLMSQLFKPENKPSNKSETLFYHMIDAMNECDKYRQKLFIIKHGSRAQINDLKLFAEESEKENIDVLDLLKLFPDIQPNPNLQALINEEIEIKKRRDEKRKRIEAIKQKDEEFLRNLNHRQRTNYPIRPPDQKKVSNPKTTISDSEEKNKNDQINKLRLSLNNHLAELKNSNQKKITSPTTNESIFSTNKKNGRRKINSAQISNNESNKRNEQLIDQEQLDKSHKHKNLIRKKKKSHTKNCDNYPPHKAPGIHIHLSDFASSSSTSAARKQEENRLLLLAQNKDNQNLDKNEKEQENQVDPISPQNLESDKKEISNEKSSTKSSSSSSETLKKTLQQQEEKIQSTFEEEEEESDSSVDNGFEFEKTLELESKLKIKIDKEEKEEEKKEQPKEDSLPFKLHIDHNPKQFVEEESHQDDYSKTEIIQDVLICEEEEKEIENEEVKIEQIIEETTIKEKRTKRKRKHTHHKNGDLDDAPKDEESQIPKEETKKTSDDTSKSSSSEKYIFQKLIEKNINRLLSNMTPNEDKNHHKEDDDNDDDENFKIKTKSHHSKHRSKSVKKSDTKQTAKHRSKSVEDKDQETEKSHRRKRKSKHRSKPNDQNDEDEENQQNIDQKENDTTEKSNNDDNSNQSSDKKSQTIVFKLQRTKENNPHTLTSSSSSSPPDFNTAELEKIKAIENHEHEVAESEEKKRVRKRHRTKKEEKSEKSEDQSSDDNSKKPLKKVPMKKKRLLNIELDKKPVIIDEEKVTIDNLGGKTRSSSTSSKTRSHHNHHQHHQHHRDSSNENDDDNNNDNKNSNSNDDEGYPSDKNYEYNYEYDYEFDDKDYYSNDNKRSKRRRHGHHYRRKTNRKFYTRHPRSNYHSSHHHNNNHNQFHNRNHFNTAKSPRIKKKSSSAAEEEETKVQKKSFRSIKETPTRYRRKHDYEYDSYSDSYNYSDNDYSDDYNPEYDDYEYEIQEEKVFTPLKLQISKNVFIHEEKENRPRNPRVFQRKIIPKQTQQQQQQTDKPSLLALSLNEGNEILNSIRQKQLKESKTLSQFEPLNEFVIHEPNESFETLRREGRGKQLDLEISQAREKLSKINKEINCLQKQLKMTLMKTSSTQVDEPFSMKSLSAMKNEIKNNENIEDLLEQARKQKELLEKEIPEKQNKLSDLQKLYVRKTTTLRHYRQMKDELDEQNFFLLNASKKQIKKLNDLDEKIRRGRRTIEMIDGRIADIKNIIDLRTKELSVKANKKRPNVVEMCSKFKQDRVSEREMLQLIEYHDIERQYLEKAIEAISYQISNDSLTKKELEIERFVIIAKQLKEKYFQKRGMSNQSMITITNEDDLNLLTKRKTLAKEEIHSTMMQIDLVISQIQKQINILNNKFIEVPPPPSSFINLQAIKKSKLESMTSLS